MERLTYKLSIKSNSDIGCISLDTTRTFFWSFAEPAGALKLYLKSSGYSCRESVIYHICQTRGGRVKIADGLIAIASISERILDWRHPIQVEPVSAEALEKFNKTWEERAEKAVRFINMIEKEAGLKQLTKLYRVKADSNVVDRSLAYRSIKKTYCSFFYMRTPKEWTKSPYMLSLAILLLRTGSSNNVPEFTNTTEFIDWLEGQKLRKAAGPIFGMSADGRYLKRVMPSCINILSHVNEIFDKSKLHWWCHSRLSDASKRGQYDISYEGVDSLITGKSLDRDLCKRFREIKKKWSLKKRKSSIGGEVNAEKGTVGA